jgi:hypothetical protein
MTDAKRKQLELARAKRKEQSVVRQTEKQEKNRAQKHEEIRGWIHGMCREYLDSQKPAVHTSRPAPVIQQPRQMTREDYMYNLIRGK